MLKENVAIIRPLLGIDTRPYPRRPNFGWAVFVYGVGRLKKLPAL